MAPSVALLYAELLIAISSCAGLATAPQSSIDLGSLQLRLLETASQLLNRTSDIDEVSEESCEQARRVREAAGALEREVREHSELAGLIDGLTAMGPDNLKSRPVARYRLRF